MEFSIKCQMMISQKVYGNPVTKINGNKIQISVQLNQFISSVA